MQTPQILIVEDETITRNTLKSIFEAEGYEVTCVLKGLGEYKGIQKLYAEHARQAELLEP